MNRFFLPLALAALIASPLVALAQEFDCIIEARQMVDIRSPVDGLIERVHAERAAVAVARQRAEAIGAVKSAEAKLELATKKEKRAEDLARQNFISTNAVEEARTERQLAESELKVARENQRLAELEMHRSAEVLGMRTLRSPVNGVVVDRYLKQGEFATTNVKDPILRIAEIDPLNVEVILPASSTARCSRAIAPRSRPRRRRESTSPGCGSSIA